MTTISTSPEPVPRKPERCGFLAPRKRVFIGVAAIVLMAVLAMGWLFMDRANTEPSHRGQPLSHWVEQIQPDLNAGPYMPFRFTAESEAAVRAIGTNAIPTLLRWIERPERGLNARITSWMEDDRIPYFVRLRLGSLIRQTYRPDQATLVFRVLKQEAKSAVPSLAQLLHSPQNSHWAVLALCAVGPDGVAALQTEYSTVSDEVLRIHRANIIHPLVLGVTRELEPQFVPFLVRVMSEDSHAAARMAAAQVLGTLTNSSPLAVPALAKAVSDRDGGVRLGAIMSLGKFGSAAASATPALRAAQNDVNGQVRIEAAAALKAIQESAGVVSDNER